MSLDRHVFDILSNDIPQDDKHVSFAPTHVELFVYRSGLCATFRRTISESRSLDGTSVTHFMSHSR